MRHFGPDLDTILARRLMRAPTGSDKERAIHSAAALATAGCRCPCTCPHQHTATFKSRGSFSGRDRVRRL